MLDTTPRAAAWKKRKMRSARRRLFTLASSCEVHGVGLHSGQSARVRLHPAPTDAAGISFRRGSHAIEARLSSVVSTQLSTTLGAPSSSSNNDDTSVSTVEHLMAALCGLGVRSCVIEIDAPELPVLDGSAAPWVEAIHAAGLEAHPAASGANLRLTKPVRVEDGDSWAIAVPSISPRLTVGIDFPEHPAIGRQWASWAPPPPSPQQQHPPQQSTIGPESATFASSVAPARTFALAEHLELMRSRGLIRGGSLDNALVCDAKAGWLNESGVRFENEPARHKLLDLVGDLALLPGHALPMCHIVAHRAGHKLHVALGKKIEAEAIYS